MMTRSSVAGAEGSSSIPRRNMRRSSAEPSGGARLDVAGKRRSTSNRKPASGTDKRGSWDRRYAPEIECGRSTDARARLRPDPMTRNAIALAGRPTYRPARSIRTVLNRKGSASTDRGTVPPRPCALHTRCTTMWLTWSARASDRVVQRPRFGAGRAAVHKRILSASPEERTDRRPDRGASRSIPSSRWYAKRRRHRPTVSRWTPIRCAISRLVRPKAASRTTRARTVRRDGLVEAAQVSSWARSSGVRETGEARRTGPRHPFPSNKPSGGEDQS